MNPDRITTRLPLPIAVAVALLLTATATAAPSKVTGASGDPRGDAPGQGDIVKVGASYQSKGKLQIMLEVADFGAAAASKTGMGAFFAKWKGGKCHTEVAGTALAFGADTRQAEHVFIPSKGASTRAGNANSSVDGNTVKVTTSADYLARRGYDCAVFITLASTGPETSELLDRASVRLYKDKRRG